MKDEDVQSDLTDAFNFVSDNDENSMISSEKMLDLLVYNGYRYTEEQAEIFMKQCDPKGKGQVLYKDFIEKLLKKGKVKTKRKGKKKKAN